MTAETHRRAGPAPWLFLLGTIAWTWSFLGLVVLTGQELFRLPGAIFSVIGLLGPLIVPVILIRTGHWDPRLDRSASGFLKRAFDPRSVSPAWYLIVVGLAAILAGLPVLLDGSARIEESLLRVGPPVFLLLGILAGAVEEPGWRGYAQEGLQRRMPVIVASLVIGGFWALWHLPLFLIPGTYQAELGLGTAGFWAFMGAIVVGSPVYAWVYNAAGHAVFAAVLYHGVGNLFRELVPDVSNAAEIGVEAGLTLMVTVAAWRWMVRRRDSGGGHGPAGRRGGRDRRHEPGAPNGP